VARTFLLSCRNQKQPAHSKTTSDKQQIRSSLFTARLIVPTETASINTSSCRFSIMSSVTNNEISTIRSVDNIPSSPTTAAQPPSNNEPTTVTQESNNLPTTPKKKTKRRGLPPLLKQLRPGWEWNSERRRWYDYNVVDMGLEKLRNVGIDVNLTWRIFSSTDKATAEQTFRAHLTELFEYITFLMYFSSLTKFVEVMFRQKFQQKFYSTCFVLKNDNETRVYRLNQNNRICHQIVIIQIKLLATNILSTFPLRPQ
jgi:hypothetical protein